MPTSRATHHAPRQVPYTHLARYPSRNLPGAVPHLQGTVPSKTPAKLPPHLQGTVPGKTPAQIHRGTVPAKSPPNLHMTQ